MKQTLSTLGLVAVLILSAIVWPGCTSKEKAVADTLSVAAHDTVASVAADTVAAETVDADNQAAKEQQITEVKTFLESFYKGLDRNIIDYKLVKKHTTAKAVRYLKDMYDYDCDGGDCMATWLFAYEAGGDTGPLKKRTIESIDENTYKVTSVYDNSDGDYKYVVKLGIVKENDTYKIDTIEPMS
ncbi:MAG: hypothetical protein J5593_06230 [Bacteroidaceae bacterium]|nr:hypothetical protein [Bacteroidaceae bacterium]